MLEQKAAGMGSWQSVQVRYGMDRHQLLTEINSRLEEIPIDMEFQDSCRIEVCEGVFLRVKRLRSDSNRVQLRIWSVASDPDITWLWHWPVKFADPSETGDDKIPHRDLFLDPLRWRTLWVDHVVGEVVKPKILQLA